MSPRVQLVVAGLPLHWSKLLFVNSICILIVPEVCHYMDEILKYRAVVYSKGHWLYFKVHFLLPFLAFVEEGMNYSVAKRVDGQLWDSARSRYMESSDKQST